MPAVSPRAIWCCVGNDDVHALLEWQVRQHVGAVDALLQRALPCRIHLPWYGLDI